MIRLSTFILLIISISIISYVNGNNVTNVTEPISSTRRPVSIKICGLALIRTFDMVCTKARQLLMKNGIVSSSSSPPAKRQINIEDDPYSLTVSITDYTRRFDCV